MLVRKEWFIDWFDSPYYHVLYNNRDDKEAHFFLQNLLGLLEIRPGEHSIIDMACGKGRHSIYLNQIGYEVLGVDLSPQSIKQAGKYANNSLHFEVQDLRELHSNQTFHVALNLFTSFGYFKSIEEDELVLKNIYRVLEPGGLLVIDFMNSEKVLQHLVSNASKSIAGIQFHISKWTENNFIYKKITVDDDDTTLEFTEKVQALTPDNFREMLIKNGFQVLHEFGDYSLNSFSSSSSDRYVIIAKKID